MINRFIISGVDSLDIGKCVNEAVDTFPEEIRKCIRVVLIDPIMDDDEEEDLGRIIYIEGHSICTTRLYYFRGGGLSVNLMGYPSLSDTHFCIELLRAVKNNYPKAEIRYFNDEAECDSYIVDLSPQGIDSLRVFLHATLPKLIMSKEEVERILCVNNTYIFKPQEFAKETEGMNWEEKFQKLHDDILDTQWYNVPKPKTYMLRWNTAISNFTLDDFEVCMRKLHTPDFEFNWSIWDWQDVREGDKVYMLRVGEGTTGIVMEGTVISDPYVAEDWSGKGRVTHYINIKLHRMMHPEKAVILGTEELAKDFPNIEWTKGHSGTLLDPLDASLLDKRFEQYLADNRDQFAPKGNRFSVAVSLKKIP